MPWGNLPRRSNPDGAFVLNSLSRVDADGMNLNQELVKQGWCWWYRKYAPADTVLEGLEKDARKAKRGLWADPQPLQSWEWQMQVSGAWRA